LGKHKNAMIWNAVLLDLMLCIFLEQNSQTFGGREIVVQDKKVLFRRNTI